MDRQQALYNFLIESDNELDFNDLKQCKYDDCSFEVNPRQTRFGASPNELAANADHVRFTLNLLYSHFLVVDDLVSSDINEGFYKTITKHLKPLIWNDSNHPTNFYISVHNKIYGEDPIIAPAGKHDNRKAEVYQHIVNFLYFQYSEGNYQREQKHHIACQQAFNRVPVQEYRDLQHTNDGVYLVLTEDEANERARESVDQYIDECLSIPEGMQNYFDREKFIDDALRYDGRGHTLGSYDGTEHEHDEYLIYRTS